MLLRLPLRVRGALLAACTFAALFAFAATPAASAAVSHSFLQRAPFRAGALRHDLLSSANWSGYAVDGASFSDVSGSWVVPPVVCASSGSSYASFWVGLGGFDAIASALEQTGTDSDCVNGHAVYSAWYEIVPDPPVTITMTVAPGDTINAHVNVSGQTATLELNDVSSGQTFSQSLPVSATDVSSAEWIAEAPSNCLGSYCQPLPLADYGSVSFSGALATAAGQQGTISEPSWTVSEVELEQSGSVVSLPSALSADGSSFAVTYQGQAPSSSTPPQAATPPPAWSGGRGHHGHGWGHEPPSSRWGHGRGHGHGRSGWGGRDRSRRH